MKKIIALSLAFLAAPAFATQVCAGNPQAVDGTAPTVASPAEFIVNTFTPKCSANVFLDYEESGAILAVGSASAKGKNIFSGTTEGGAVAPTGTLCASTGCVATDSSGAATAALASAGSGT